MNGYVVVLALAGQIYNLKLRAIVIDRAWSSLFDSRQTDRIVGRPVGPLAVSIDRIIG